ncbi:GT-D fold domain-containing glycosyltransferase [Paenibacillus artemisiicola]|uniref:GT-D fold domain-containing protein n=1 Tax=Paenibacillus artemisiicola TaxID=1172618 RepID=UPI001F0A9217|nr:GT-D fold domain-containing glycosyltransferase [Paenibacillus artemisiicola]
MKRGGAARRVVTAAAPAMPEAGAPEAPQAAGAADAAKPAAKRSAAGRSAKAASASAAGGTKARRSAGKKRTRTRKGASGKRRGRGRGRTGRSSGRPVRPGEAELLANGGPAREPYNENAYMAGYDLGLYEGGELLLEQATPIQRLLPEISLRDVIALGAEQIAHRCLPLLDVSEVYEEMEAAIRERRPCAVVRLGDGELLTLAQDAVHDMETIRREGGFLPYAGVHPPDLRARDELAAAIRQAHIVGVPLSRRKHFQPLLHPVLRAHRIPPESLRMTHSAVNYSLHQTGLLGRLLAGKRLLVVGNLAPALGHALNQRGYAVTGAVSPVNGVGDVERVLQEIRGFDFDLALVSAGIAAVMLCTRIAGELGRAALDFGHMADGIAKGKYAL